VSDTIELGEQRYVEMSEAEQLVLTISERGFGKRSSSMNIERLARRQRHRRHGGHRQDRPRGRLVPVEDADQIMLVNHGRPAHPHSRRRHPHRQPLDGKA